MTDDAAPGFEAPSASPRETSPYPGLRSFSREEASIFFGRENSLKGMTETLQATRFLAVLGPSGGGKSSLVRSGLFMHLEAGMARRAGERWRFLDIKHPRTKPYRELAAVTLQSEREAAAGRDDPDAQYGSRPITDEEVAQRRRLFRLNPMALVDWWRSQPRHASENLLLLVDQFEELFGYSTGSERDDVEAFVDLLIRTIGQEDLNIYVVITMRSEYLGGCSLFPGLAEQINLSLSLTPRMTWDECRKAITGPAYGRRLVLDPLLVTAVLNDMNSLAPWTDAEPAKEAAKAPDAEGEKPLSHLSQSDLIARRADQLPLMQHVLNWLWNIADSKRSDPEEPITLTLDDYLTARRLGGSLDKHAREIMNITGEPELTARIFRAITKQSTVVTSGAAETTAVRRRRTVAEIAREVDASEERVCAVVEAFRAEGVSMLTPDPDTDLTSDEEIDISHESIIRQWSDLRRWLREEAEAGRSWGELLRDVDKGKSLRGLDLSERIGWRKRTAPHEGWAERYGGHFERVDKYLNDSARAEQRRKVLLRTATGGLVAMGLLSGFSVVGTQAARRSAENDRMKAARLALDADQQAANARKVTAAAELRTRQAMASARNALAQALASSRAAALARASALAAETAKADAAVQMRAATAQVAMAREESERLDVQSRELANNLADDLHRPRIRAAAESDSPEGFAKARKGIEELRAMRPEMYATLANELYRARGDAKANRFATREMIDLADSLAKTAREQVPDPAAPEAPAVLLAQAYTLRGRGLWLEGKDHDALTAFDEAMRGLPDPQTLPARVARADAAYEKAAALLAQGSTAAAATAANDCLKLLPAESEPGDDDFALRVTRAHCLGIAFTLDNDDEQARKRWKEAMQSLAVAEAEDNRLLMAQWDLLDRYSRRFHTFKADGRNVDLGAAGDRLLETFLGMSEPTDPNAAFAKLQPADALQRVRLIGGIVPAFMDEEGDMTENMIVSLMYERSQQLLGQVAARAAGEGNARILEMISDAFLESAQAQIDLVGKMTEMGAGAFDDAPPRAAQSIADHVAFLRRNPALAEQRMPRVREQALSLLRAIEPTLKSRRYSGPESPSAIGELLVGSLCEKLSQGPGQGCDPLTRQAAEVERAAAAEAKRVAVAAGHGEAPVWVDSNGVALGGLDPASCLSTEFSMADIYRQLFRRRDNVIEPAKQRTCTVRSGRYVFPLASGGSTWLFDSEQTRADFVSRSEQLLPQLGGNDVVAAANNEFRPPRLGNVTGVIFGRGIYLTDIADAGSVVTNDIIDKADKNWAARPSARPGK